MVDWPAVINYQGDDELTCVGSAAEWERDAKSHLYNHGGDRLIDSSGHVYNNKYTQQHTVDSEYTGERMALQDFVRLVRVHASCVHRCCIEKISFRTIAEGVELVAAMHEEDA